MLTDAVIEPLTGEDGTLEDVDPEEGHEDNLNHFTMGHAQELTSGKATFRYLDPFTMVFHLNKE